MRFRSVLLSCVAFASIAGAQSPSSVRGLELFEKKIRPALIQYCFECHAADADDIGGGLLLDSRQGLLQGGESGPALVPGKPADSLLLDAIEYRELEMPPDEKLPESVIANFRRWIALGAVDPRDAALPPANEVDPQPSVESRPLWSLRPVTVASLPPVGNSQWPQENLDRFILAELEKHDLSPNADADPTTLLRRVFFDLTGLPPSPAEVEAFASDPSQEHFAQVVDRLLGSPAFGERWGRHWLDVARYAESAGSSRDVLTLYAWRYRDFVIQAFNEDMPFDRFVQLQVAGDLLPAHSREEKKRNQVATGLLAIGSKSLNGGNLTYDVIDDQIDVVSKAVLGLTVACARCHDHKFDPIPTKDYYALAGIFLSTDTRYGGGIKRPKNVKERTAEYLVLESDTDSEGVEIRDKAEAEVTREPEYAVGVREAKKITDAHVLIRGEKGQPGDVAARGFLTAIGDRCQSPSTAIDAEESGRRELAQWLTDPQNPLTPRVAVNRIWQHLMGDGLVATVDNFGVSGLPPSHPQLLDQLAHRFIHVHHWSTKAMIREVVLSRTYQLSSEFNETAFEVDPENRLRWRMTRRRLEAEPLRDAVLAVSGLLKAAPLQGSLVMEIGEGEVGRNIDTSVLEKPFDHRSVYLPVIRGIIPEPLKLFDFPEPSNVQGRRDSNTTPTQSLFLMNSDFAIRAARAMADQLLTESTLSSDRDRVRSARMVCFSRHPSDDQIDRDLKFLRQMSAGRSSDDAEKRRLAWTAYCQSLLASAKFRFID